MVFTGLRLSKMTINIVANITPKYSTLNTAENSSLITIVSIRHRFKAKIQEILWKSKFSNRPFYAHAYISSTTVTPHTPNTALHIYCQVKTNPNRRSINLSSNSLTQTL